MKQEFVTLYGKAVIEQDILYLRSTYLPFEKTAFAEIGIEVIWILLFASRLFFLDSSMHIMTTIIWGVLLISTFPTMYDKFFKRSYASRIPVGSIQNITTQEDGHGIQTEVRLQLNNGRYKIITFRNLEGELERFADTLSVYNINFEKGRVAHS